MELTDVTNRLKLPDCQLDRGPTFSGIPPTRMKSLLIIRRLRNADLLALVATTAHAQLSFEFNFTDSNSGFNDPTQGAARRAALETAGQELSNQLPINRSVTITFDVSSNNADDSILASAGSDFMGDTPGFYPTIAHRKVLDGTDGNGTAADGAIEWNFFHEWDLDINVAAESFDFISTAMHEIMHAIGFTGALYSDGTGYFEGNIGEPNAGARSINF